MEYKRLGKGGTQKAAQAEDSGISVKSFIASIMEKLDTAFPDFSVYDTGIEQLGYENCFHVKLIKAKQKRVIGNRFNRDYDFDISFYPEDDSIDSFYEWEAKMLLAFDTMTVGQCMYHIKDVETSNTDGVWHFIFAVSFFIVQSEETDLMEDLSILQEFI